MTDRYFLGSTLGTPLPEDTLGERTEDTHPAVFVPGGQSLVIFEKGDGNEVSISLELKTPTGAFIATGVVFQVKSDITPVYLPVSAEIRLRLGSRTAEYQNNGVWVAPILNEKG